MQITYEYLALMAQVWCYYMQEPMTFDDIDAQPAYLICEQ